jgi:hypothetical protein
VNHQDTSSKTTDSAAAFDGPENIALDKRTPKTIDGHRVHPLASAFPLLKGKEFDDFVESIRRAGTVTPIEFHDGLLIDGRNRLLAAKQLRAEGVKIYVPTIDWQPLGDETVEEHIYAVNVHRRHLTDDQRAALATRFLPGFRARAVAKRKKSFFKSKAAGVGGTVAEIPPTPCDAATEGAAPPDERSPVTVVGQFMEMAKVSETKAKQAVALDKAIAEGVVPPEILEDVARGKVPLRKAAPKKVRRSAAGSSKPLAPTCDDFDDADELDASEENVRTAWARFKDAFAISEHPEVRRILAEIIAEERTTFDT